MFVIRLKPPYGKEHFGGSVGVVDWGRDGEYLNVFENNSSFARYIKSRPDLYRAVIVPSMPTPKSSKPPMVSDDNGTTWYELKTEAKELGIGIYGVTKPELIELVAKAKNKGQ